MQKTRQAIVRVAGTTGATARPSGAGGAVLAACILFAVVAWSRVR